MLVIVVLSTLHIGFPADFVSLALTVASILISSGGNTLMANINDMVVCGAHGAAKSILWGWVRV